MKQRSFADAEYAAKPRQTRQDRFLSKIDAATPWPALLAVIDPFYPKAGNGRPPLGCERMLRMYVAQQCLGFSDEGIEDAIYDSGAIRRFVGIDLGRESSPDATTVLKFRRLLETHGLTKLIFETIKGHLAEQGLLMREGTIVDATLIAASPSTKNKAGERDPEMHQSKKGNQWHFGMKAHIGVDAASGLVRSLIGTAGNVADITQAHALLHGEERHAHGDAGYQGVEKREECNPEHTVAWQIAMRPGKRRKLPDTEGGRLLQQTEQLKSSLRAKVEHPFHIIKNLFRHRKARYRGLFKNTAQLYSLFGLANLLIAARRIPEPSR